MFSVNIGVGWGGVVVVGGGWGFGSLVLCSKIVTPRG